MRTTGDMFTATAARGATWLAVGAFAFTAVSATGQDGGDAGWYPAVRAEIDEFRTEFLSDVAGVDLPDGARAQLRSQIEGALEGLFRNLDAEIAGVGPRLLAARLEHGPQEDHFCSAENVASRLALRAMEDPVDAGDALMAAAQCREAYQGAVSLPVFEELEGLRELCVSVRDSIVEQPDDPSVAWEPERAAVYAVARCAAWKGAAWVRYSLTGAHFQGLRRRRLLRPGVDRRHHQPRVRRPLEPGDGGARGVPIQQPVLGSPRPHQ